MVIVKVKDKEFYMDGYMKENLDFVKSRIQKRNEMFICILDGRVGSGKSTLADQYAYYCSDGNFDLKDKAFTVDDFDTILTNKIKGEAHNNVILDEAFEINKRKTTSMANMKILKKLQRIRSKNLYIWIVLPCLYDLDKNVILQLTNMFVHCYTDYDYGPKGRFASYSRKSLKNLWLKCRDTLSYYPWVSMPNFRGRFTKAFPSGDYNTYEKRKNDILDKADIEIKPKNKAREQRNKLIRNWAEEHGMKSALKFSGLSRQQT